MSTFPFFFFFADRIASTDAQKKLRICFHGTLKNPIQKKVAQKLKIFKLIFATHSILDNTIQKQKNLKNRKKFPI
jgi:hypothetical protein